jgi:hypothetical protein
MGGGEVRCSQSDRRSRVPSELVTQDCSGALPVLRPTSYEYVLFLTGSYGLSFGKSALH